MLLAAFLWVMADTGAVVPTSAARTCGADSLSARVPVYVRPTVAVRADTMAASALLLIAESVATRIRATLGARIDEVPEGERVRAAADSMWRRDTTVSRARTGLDSASLRVVARRNGSFEWVPTVTPLSPAAALLDRALRETKAADEAFIPAELFATDSIAFTLGYLYRFDVVSGRVRPRVQGSPTLAAFTLRTQVEKPAGVAEPIRLQYPTAPLGGRAEGTVILQYVVDTTGRAVPSTVRDLWPANRPRLTGDLGDYYRAFVAAATDAVGRARYYPAEIGGCKVRQLVQQSFSYGISRTR